jgi:hypothetical protein
VLPVGCEKNAIVADAPAKHTPPLVAAEALMSPFSGSAVLGQQRIVIFRGGGHDDDFLA